MTDKQYKILKHIYKTPMFRKEIMKKFNLSEKAYYDMFPIGDLITYSNIDNVDDVLVSTTTKADELIEERKHIFWDRTVTRVLSIVAIVISALSLISQEVHIEIQCPVHQAEQSTISSS